MLRNHCNVGDRADAVMAMLSWGQQMQRDDDLLRSIMLEIEAHEDPLYPTNNSINSSVEGRAKLYHMKLLADAGFLEESGKYGGIFRITMQGHDFLALTRSSESWGAVKNAATQLGGASVRMLGEIAYGLAKDKLRAMGVPLA